MSPCCGRLPDGTVSEAAAEQLVLGYGDGLSATSASGRSSTTTASVPADTSNRASAICGHQTSSFRPQRWSRDSSLAKAPESIWSPGSPLHE
jgi:hypothetical protein